MDVGLIRHIYKKGYCESLGKVYEDEKFSHGGISSWGERTGSGEDVNSITV